MSGEIYSNSGPFYPQHTGCRVVIDINNNNNTIIIGKSFHRRSTTIICEFFQKVHEVVGATYF